MPSLAKFVNHYFPTFSIVDSILSFKVFTLLYTSSHTRSRQTRKASRLPSDSDEILRKKVSSPSVGENAQLGMELGEIYKSPRGSLQPSNQSHATSDDQCTRGKEEWCDLYTERLEY